MREISPHLLSASTVMGGRVVNAEGEHLGELKELVLDSHSGRVAYAVLAFGGLLGFGEKLFAVPWEAFRVSPLEDKLYLDVPRERLKDAPGFDHHHWPHDADREFQREVYEHYGYRPYWTSPVERMPPSKDSARAETAEPSLPSSVEDAYSGQPLSGSPGRAAPSEASQHGAYGAAYGLESAADYSTQEEHTMRHSRSGNKHSNRKQADARGAEEQPADLSGSPARGYGRTGINRAEDIGHSLNPASDLGYGHDEGNAEETEGLEDDTRSWEPTQEESASEKVQRSRGEQAADEFNPGLSGSISDLDSSQGRPGGAMGDARRPSSTTPPGDTQAFDRSEDLPATGTEAGPGLRDMSGASGISSASSTGGSEGLSAAEDLQIGDVDDLNVVGTNLGPEYPPDMTVTEDEDTQQPKAIRPGAQTRHSDAGDTADHDVDESQSDTRGVDQSSGAGRGHSSGSSPGRHHRGSRGDTDNE